MSEPEIQKPEPKKHISFSELSVWEHCAYKHKLKYIDLISLDKPSEHTIFGHTIHGMLEEYLRTRIMPSVQEAKAEFIKTLDENKIVVNEKEFHDAIEPIVTEVPKFLEERFKDWKYIAAEQFLYEAIKGHEGRFFKGFIDGIIQIPKSSRLKRCKPDELETHVLDWKTCAWGWDMKKKTDPIKQRQLALYKHYWSEKINLPLKEIRCNFVLLKRLPAKNRPRCELVPVSVGDKTIENALEAVNKMLLFTKKKLYPKNRNDCRFCEYSGTKYCI